MQLWWDTASLPIPPDSSSLSGSTLFHCRAQGTVIYLYMLQGPLKRMKSGVCMRRAPETPKSLWECSVKGFLLSKAQRATACLSPAIKWLAGCRNTHMEVPNHKAMFQPSVWAPEKQKGKLMPFPQRNSCLWKSELPHYCSRRKDVLAGVQIIRAL